MLFNSLQFALFFTIVFALYCRLNHKWQNRILLLASYIFYGSWNWKFLSLIWISTILDYFCGLKINSSENFKKKKLFVTLSILGNLLILGSFKYFNFFIGNLESIFDLFGLSLGINTLNIILPVGISFYTFQTMSYTIDIYRGNIKPTKNFYDFALFVAFFPQLVAGPIEKAKHLLPQIQSKRSLSLEKFYEGCYLIFWGLFLKVVISDNLAIIVDPIFQNYAKYSGASVLVGVYAFAFQIFCDFAGYSSIARGLGKVMGFDIVINFNLPYFSTNPSEFWRRWHISLSSWLKEYLYIPLGGNRKGTIITYRNLALTMLLGGLWHGASWTFVFWGLYQGILLIFHRLLKPFLEKLPKPNNYIIERTWFCFRVLFFFHLICIGWIFFRSQTIGQAFSMLKVIFFSFGPINLLTKFALIKTIFFISILLIVQCFQFIKKDLLIPYKSHWSIRTALYSICLILFLIYGSIQGNEFIYFQF